MPQPRLKLAEEPSTGVRRGVSYAKDPKQAAEELYQAIAQPDMALAVFFCATHYDREILAKALQSKFGDTVLIGCTTGGEITPEGYERGYLTGFSLAAPDFTVVADSLEDLQNFSIGDGRALSPLLLERLAQRATNISGENTFAFLLIDGKSLREEMVTHALHSGLKDISLVGASAGPGFKSAPADKTYVYYKGEFRTNRAVVALVNTTRSFVVFKTENYVPTDKRLVITGSDPATRRVFEINGSPATEEYAQLIGLDPDKLDHAATALHKLGLYSGGSFYLRSIGWINDDKSFTFACAIDEGMVLSFAKTVDYMEDLTSRFEKIRAEIGAPDLTIACDCLHRWYEAEHRGILAEVSAVFKENNAIGFSTFGEQLNSMHINHTLVGVAIGKSK